MGIYICNVTIWHVRVTTVGSASPLIFDTNETVNNTEVFMIITEMQQSPPFALFPRYRILSTAANGTKLLGSSCTLPHIVLRFYLNLELYQ